MILFGVLCKIICYFLLRIECIADTAAIQYMLTQAYERRDTRVEEAKAAEAQRPTVADRAAEQPRPKGPKRGTMVDVLA